MLNFRSLFFPAHVRAQVHVCQALTVTWLCLPPFSFFRGCVPLCVCFASRQVTDFTFRSGLGNQCTVSFFFVALWQFRLARSLKAAFALSGPVVSGSQGPVPVSQCPSLALRLPLPLFIAARYPSAPQPQRSQLCLRQPHAFPLALGSAFSLQFSPFYSCVCLHCCSWLPPFLATFPAMRRQRLVGRWGR